MEVIKASPIMCNIHVEIAILQYLSK